MHVILSKVLGHLVFGLTIFGWKIEIDLRHGLD